MHANKSQDDFFKKLISAVYVIAFFV